MTQSSSHRVLLREEPFLPKIADCSWLHQGVWPCFWIGHPHRATPQVTAFRKNFSVKEATVIRVHVTADERYELYLNGERVGKGPERGDLQNWFFETYDLAVPAGEHSLAARVWSMGPAAPRSQISSAPGFLLAPDDDRWIPLLGTGATEWKVKELAGYQFERPFPHDFFSVGYSTILNGDEIDWDWLKGLGDNWEKAVTLHPGSSATFRNRVAPAVHLLRPATLPAMLEKVVHFGQARHVDSSTGVIRRSECLEHELASWNALFTSATALEAPPHTFWRVIVDLGDYRCAYPELTLRGGKGSSLHVRWAESLFHEPEARTKGNREEIEGKFFSGYGDLFRPLGTAREYSTVFWRAGRYIEIQLQTAGEAMLIERCELRTTRYPWQLDSEIRTSDPDFPVILEAGVRTLQASTHDSFIDGPYYEQMMWAGDGVQNSLTSYVLTRDDRLTRKMLSLFNASRSTSGLTAARWPARDRLVIPSYSLLWIFMIREFAYWRNDPAFVRSLIPGVRSVIQAFETYLTSEGLIQPTMGWNFIDWVPGWPDGIPPGQNGESGILSWQFVRALEAAAEIEDAFGDAEFAQWNRRKSSEMTAALHGRLWDSKRGLFADTPSRHSYSEHIQAEAILSGKLGQDQLKRLERTLLEDTGLTRTTISYSHYLFEAYRILDRIDGIFERLELWRGLRKLGLITTPEGPEPTRSDCHAWGAHPIYHFFSSMVGLRPASPNFRTVICTPRFGALEWAKGRLVHPDGEIMFDMKYRDGSYQGRISLPLGIHGTLMLPDCTIPLTPGPNEFGPS